LQTTARIQKNTAVQEFQEQNYEKALKIFHFALLLHPEDSSKASFKRSVESHQASAYFKLKKYEKALEVGESSHESNPSYKSTVCA